ncbi:glucose dehydrogenase [Thermoplasma sp. Kam2015]|uniref:SDR family oxidoreductase n=1 Tax=Thermoplasma sp. Kam2015 TaxID=2094122 RepID=UPI000D882CD4|nr:SDR family oxidoreductase [Thermoplasma sp. Kam2015]PYB69012.1 glucose dehydrogenase [Thermoplasma sp. Kam2015]
MALEVRKGISIDLTDRVVLVTGSSSGLGESIARYMAQAGAKVVVHYRTGKDRAEKIVSEIKAAGGKAIALGGDVSNKEEVRNLFLSIDKAFGPIDILVNNAGIDGKRGLVGDDNTDDWEEVIGVNLMGPYYCAREASKRMKPRKTGVIINITSVHEYVPWSGYSAYCSAKAGLSMFTKTLAQELSDFNIRVVAIAPGAIKTPINKDVWGNPESLKDLLDKIAMPRLGEVDDIGRVAVFLASDLASYITGTTVLVDGGMALYPDFKHGG